jgi:hypothetical protein
VTLDLIFERLWLPLKGISIEKTYIGKLSCTITITLTQRIRRLTRGDEFIVDFLCEFKAIFCIKGLERVDL